MSDLIMAKEKKALLSQCLNPNIFKCDGFNVPAECPIVSTLGNCHKLKSTMELVAEEFRNQPIMIIMKNNLKHIMIPLNLFLI